VSAEALPAFASVIVVGAGPTGLTVATLLARYGVDVVVLERNTTVAGIPRAIVLDDEGARALQAAGIIPDLLPHLVPGDGPIFYDDDGSVLAALHSGSEEYGFRKRYFMHQPELEHSLRRHLEQFTNARLVFEAEVADLVKRPGGVEVTVRHQGRVQHSIAQVVLACDGARSSVRALLGINMRGDSYEESWLVIDTLNDPDTSRSSKAFCSVRRPYMSIPAPRGGRRYEFRLLPGETRESMLRPNAVRALMDPIRTLADSDILRMAVYNFEARLAERLVEGRVLLLGDAAHLTPPFAGQGMNAGLRDALNVAWKVALFVRGKAASRLLQSYETERRDGIWAMIQIAMSMGEIIMPRTDNERAIRAALLEKLSAFPGGREYLLGMRFKPRPRFEQGVLINCEPFVVPASLVGCMIPQPRIALGDKQRQLDDALGAGFALLAQSKETAQFAAGKRDLLWPELAPTVVDTSGTRGIDAVKEISILESEIAAPFRAHRDQLLLIRPDRHAALAFWPHNADAAVAAFRAKLYN
jgi:3-(3-hydroxy-phenyl)propionate hydroxylase